MAVYFIYGKEPFLLDTTIAGVVESIENSSPDAVELIRLDADELTPFELGESLQFSALFVTERIIVIKRPYWLTGDKKRAAKAGDDFATVLTSYLEHPESGQTLILAAEEKQSSNKVIKLLEKSSEVQMIAVAEWTPNQVKDWIRGSLNQHGQKMDEASIHRMVTSGHDLYYLHNLLEKLVLLGWDEIPAEVLVHELEAKSDIKIFKLLDGVLARNPKAAMQAMQTLIKQGEAVPYILFMLFRQWNMFAWVKALQEEGNSPSNIEVLTGQKSFTVKNLLKYSRNFTWEEIEARLQDLLLIDTSMKSTNKDTRLQLECLILKFAPN